MSETTTTAKAGKSAKHLGALGMFSGFIPWIVFAVVAQRLAANGVAWSALIAACVSLVGIIRGRRSGGPTQLDTYSLGLFGVIAVVGFVGDDGVDRWLYEWGRPLVGVALGLVVLATALFRPFTAEYSKRETPREYWNSPLFHRVNLVLSASWGAAITVMGAASVLVTAIDAHADGTDSAHLVDLLLNWVIPIALIAGMIRFTNSYPDRARARFLGADAPA